MSESCRRLPPRSHSSQRGFTLLEILVSIAILAGMVVLLASVAHQVGNAWQRVEGENQRREAARTLLHFLARELQAISKPVPTAPGAANAANLQLLVNLPASVSDPDAIPPALLSPHAIFYQAPVAQNTSRGNIAAVGYFVRWDTSQPSKALPRLCRFFVEPANTANYLIYTPNGNWPSVASTVAPAVAPTYQGWLSDNVIALWVRCLDASGRPITQNATGETLNSGYGFDSRQGYRDPATAAVHPAPALPPCIEIALVVVDSRTASNIKTPIVPTVTAPADFSKDASTPGSILYFMEHLPPEIKAGARVFSTRVFLTTSKAL